MSCKTSVSVVCLSPLVPRSLLQKLVCALGVYNLNGFDGAVLCPLFRKYQAIQSQRMVYSTGI